MANAVGPCHMPYSSCVHMLYVYKLCVRVVCGPSNIKYVTEMDRRKKGFKSEWGNGKADSGLFYSSYQSNRLNEYSPICFALVLSLLLSMPSNRLCDQMFTIIIMICNDRWRQRTKTTFKWCLINSNDKTRYERLGLACSHCLRQTAKKACKKRKR